MMDEQSRKTLDEILTKEPAALTEADEAFMRARRSYLSEEQKAVFADVLAEQPETPVGATSAAPDGDSKPVKKPVKKNE